MYTANNEDLELVAIKMITEIELHRYIDSFLQEMKFHNDLACSYFTMLK